MIPLSANGIKFHHMAPVRRVLKVDACVLSPQPLRKNRAFVFRGDKQIPEGYGFYVCFEEKYAERLDAEGKPYALLKEEYNYISDADILRVLPESNSMRVLFRHRNQGTNSFLLTERCNHLCLMCSQPPRNINDSWIAKEMLEVIPLIERDTAEIGFTGGEPTLLGDDFLAILQSCKNFLPETAVHILSNGRTFLDREFTEKYARIDHPDMMIGIPIYSDVSSIHDYVVQADGAFDETIRGILNLKRYKQKVEVRVVVHKQTYQRLPQLATFITRNLAFVDHVALMGLEITGFTKANMGDLWIDPYEYKDQLREATNILAMHRMNVSIYNHQLCTLPSEIWKFSRKAISDWKNEYHSECTKCTQRERCGGFFTTQLTKPSAHIHAFSS